MKKQAVIGIICCICMLCAACGNAAEPAPTPKPVEATVGKVVEVTEEIITIQTTEDATHTFERQNAQLKLNGYRLMEGDRVEVQHRNPYEALVITLVEPGEEAKRYRVVDDLLAGMSVEEKVGQLFLVRCPTQGAAQDAADYHLGGYVLFKPNTENQTPAGLKEEIASYQEASRIPMLIAVDEEGGLVNRISQLPQFRSAPFRSPQALFRAGGLELVSSDTQEKAQFLKKLVQARYSIVIGGGTGSGKTTFLGAVTEYIPKDERLITIEDNAELKIRGIDNLVCLEAKMANMAGAVSVTIRDLIRSALRMRPDRIIVGEVRGGEAVDMLQSLNTGHDGSLSTLHANSSQDMLSRIETMTLMGIDLPLEAIRRQIASGVDILVHLGRMRDKSRKLLEITEVCGFENGEIQTRPLYRWEEGKGLVKTGELLHCEKMKRAGIRL